MKPSLKCFRGNRMSFRSLSPQLVIAKRFLFQQTFLFEPLVRFDCFLERWKSPVCGIYHSKARRAITWSACKWRSPSDGGDSRAKGNGCRDDKRSGTGLTGLGVILISSHGCVNISLTKLGRIHRIKTDGLPSVQLRITLPLKPKYRAQRRKNRS